MNSKKIKYIFRQTGQSMLRNKMMGMASVGSVTAVLIILGYIVLMVLNINNVALVTKEEFDEIAVYLVEDASNEEIKKMGDEIKSINGVLSVVYQSKDDALELEKEKWGEDAYLLDGLRRNPLPNSYIVQLKDVKYSESVIEKIKDFSIVEDTRYYQDAVKSLVSISGVLQKVGTVIIGILILISIFIISNTIKITVVFRRKEIELMQYIGASNGYVRGPFIIEGIVLGTIGSLIAIGVIALSYNYFTGYMTGTFALLSGFTSYIVEFKAIFKDILIIFITLGIGIGSLGSLISLKKFLNA